ncbi:hypothetical protein WJX79_001773 [Trebouxia sp. C0005]
MWVSYMDTVSRGGLCVMVPQAGPQPPVQLQQHLHADQRTASDDAQQHSDQLGICRKQVTDLQQALDAAHAEHMDYDFLQLQLQECESASEQQTQRIQELEAQCLDCSTLTAQLQTKDAAIEALQQRLDQLEDERLLRELLPSSGISPDVVNTSRGSQSQEDWLVSSETKSAVHDAVHEVTDVQQRLQLHEVLADQLQGQLQQQQESKERLEQSLREQQDVAATLKIQLDQSRNEAEELRSQIAVSHGREEEARQRVQLQDVLGEQLLSQLQEVTQQRDEHKSIAHELRSALADMSRQMQSDRLPANQSSATTSSQVPCLNSQFAMAVVDRPRHKSVHVSPDETPSIGPGPINRANSSATVIVQPLQPHQAAVPSWSEAEVTDTQMPVRLLPVPATSALAAHPSHSSDHLLSQQSSQFESDRMTHGMSRQPPADECLFGSPPRGQNDNHVQHSSAHRQESVYHTAVGGLALLDSVALGTKPEALGAAVAAETADGSAILMTEDSEQSFMELLQAAQQQRMFAEAVLQPGHLPDPAASLQDVPVSLTHSAAAMQWELQHLKENLAAAKQQEADTMHRVRDTERQLASLQTALAQQQEHHDRQSAQISKEADAKVECIKALQEDLSELQRQLAAQRQQLESNETQLQQLSEAKEEEERHLHRLQAKLWQEASRQSLDEVAQAEAPSAGFVNKSTTELESNASSMLQAAYTRVKGQYQAAAKRINELEALQQLAMTVAQEHQLAMHQKQAELVATKQSVRSAVADHMRSMPASASQVAKYDDLIEEASGELERVEGEVHSATQQLLDLQGHVSQLAHHTQAAEKTLQKKEEEVRSMQAELHSTLAGVTAARHEQQEEQRKIAQLKHQHEDTLQAEAHVRTQMTEVQAELQALKASRQRHAEQQKDKDQVTIRLNREAEAAALGQMENLQEGKGTSMESSGSNQAGFRFHDSPCMQTIHAEQLLLLASTTEPSARVNARLEQAVADDEQQTAHLKARLRDEEDRRQQAERQLLQMQHGSLPTTSLRGSPLPQGSPLPADCHQITGSAELPEKDRTDVSAWEAHAVQMEAEHEVVTSELHAVKEQLRTYAMQVADLEAFNGKLTDECLMRKQQAEYLHGRMETCQQEISILESEQQQGTTDAQIAVSSLQDELRLTKQAFHAKQDQLEDACCKLQETQASLHDIQHALQSSQGEAQSLQTRMDAATRGKQEAEALCHHLRDEVQKLQGQLAGTHHSMTLFQSQQLELQSGGSQLESMQVLLRDARQHAADLQTDKQQLQHMQNRLKQALLKANQEITQLQASAAEGAERSAAAVQAQQGLQNEVQAQQQATEAEAKHQHPKLDSAGEQEETAAEKKLLRAEVASLKRQAAQQRKSLQIIQHDVHQVPHQASAGNRNMRLSVPPNASDLARSGSVSPEASAKSVRTRSGLFGFFRPQKTVSPLTQQATQDLPVAKPRTSPQTLRTQDEAHDSGIPAESGSAWSTLPEHLIESVMEMLQTETSPPLHHSNKTSRQTQFAVTSVSKNWRQIGRRAFFKELWNSSGAITHPVQLFGLSHENVSSHLVKCVMKRESAPARPKAVKYTLRLGDKMSNSAFMMAALQGSRLDIKMYLTSSCTGMPCARIETNLLGTRYEVVLDSTVQPFAQHEATHSHTAPMTFDKLPRGVQYKTRIRGFMRPRRMKVTLPDPSSLACFDTSNSCCSKSPSEELSSRLPASLLVTSAFSADGLRQSTDQTGAHEPQVHPPSSPSYPQADQESPESSAASALTHVAPMTPGPPTPSQTDSQSPATPRRPSLLPSQKGVELQNKPPHWNDTLRCWCLNFRGRVKLASVKNFQLIKAEDPNKAIVMQFGKVDSYTYIMDYNPAEITAIQAFAISLSTFDTKLLL